MRVNLRSAGVLASFALACGGLSAVDVHGQCEQLHETGRLIVPETFFEGQTSLAATENLVFMGDAAGGRVYVFERVGDSWTEPITLTASDAEPGDRFGWAVATDGVTLVASAPFNEATDEGAVYVFRQINGQWKEEAKLIGGNPTFGRRIGWSLAVSGDLFVATSAVSGAFANGPGKVYLFVRENDTWIEQQQLNLDTTSMPNVLPQFLSVAMHGTEVLIGGPGVGGGTAPGSAYFFSRVGDTWEQQQQLLAPDQALGDAFGDSVAFSNDWAVISAPSTTNGETPIGAAHFFHRGEAGWEHIHSEFGASQSQFGDSVAARQETLMVSAPYEDTGVSYGAIHVYAWNGKEIAHQYRLVATQQKALTNVAESMALAPNFLIATTTRQNNYFSNRTWALFFADPPLDCNVDGVPDLCEPDCNANQQSDWCEIAAGTSGDCNVNGVPDECESLETYQLDHGILGGFWLGNHQLRDHLWLNAFGVRAGGEVLTHIALPWTPASPSFTPVEVLVYDDPNNDGVPDDAVLLSSTEAVMLIPDETVLPPMARIAIPPTYVGEPGDSFFIGAYVRGETSSFPITSDSGNHPLAQRSWYLGLPLGTTILNDLSKNSAAPHKSAQWNWILRGIAIDCNGNGQWDQCDIDEGTSKDANGDGQPDECKGPCPPDLTVDGDVNIDDLLVIINHWSHGAGSPGDANGDGTVDINDLLMVIVNWGPC